MAAAAVSSASPLLALLEEEDDQLKVYALKQLDGVVQHFWYQISNYIPQVEALYEDDTFVQRERAALLASKVFYHLRELDEALNYALGAGSLFDITDTSEYVQTLIGPSSCHIIERAAAARCLDKYFELRQAQQPDSPPIDKRLEGIVERMIQRCCDDRQYHQAIGITLEARRLDKLEEVVGNSEDVSGSLHYALVVTKTVVCRSFREEVIRLLIRMYEQYSDIQAQDWVTVCQCLMLMDDAEEVARILARLLESETEKHYLLAYQIAFDLFDNDMQAFMQRVQARLDALKPAAAAREAAQNTESDSTTAATTPHEDARSDIVKRYEKITSIISGAWPIHLQLEFLYWQNAADLQLLKNIKDSFDARVSICHSATIIANAFMHSGTTVDTFLRDNLDWLSRATNWAKFGATASLGVVHRGHLQQGKDLMAPHLPQEGRQVSPYSEGGALYALGIIHANHGQAILPFLLQSLRNSSHDVVQHGACLGIGLAGLGTNDAATFEELKDVLYTDSAVGGEAAGMAMGLLSAGSESSKAKDMLAYARDTQHEKIIRGLAMGLAIISYGREEAADAMIEQLTLDKDPILRYGGMYAIGMAYRGTDNNSSIQKLLHFAVSDVSDNVRRAAVLNLGFVLLGCPEQCPRIVNLLAESYNPHLRYGAAMAVGIACAATGLKEAEALLKPMLKDRVDFVRQGALIAMSFVMIQQPEASIADFRKHLETTYGDKHEDVMCKMGAIMASGIIDAGGRNATVGLLSSSGYMRRTAVISMALFTQYWYWFPMAYMLSLTFKATAFIGLTPDLRLPRMTVTCNCKKGVFAYAKPVAENANKQIAKLPQAILSTTKKAQRRAKAKAERKVEEASGPLPAATSGDTAATSMDVDDDKKSTTATADGASTSKEEPAKTEDDQTCPYDMENPARIVPAQQRHVSHDKAARFRPLKANAKVGILILQDSQPTQPIEYVEKQTLDVGSGPAMPAVPEAPAQTQAPAAEPEAPEDFDFDG